MPKKKYIHKKDHNNFLRQNAFPMCPWFKNIKKKSTIIHVLINNSSNLHTFPNSIQLSFWLFLSDIQYPMTIDDDDRLSFSVISTMAILRHDRHTDIVFFVARQHTAQVACARFTCQQTNVVAMHICDSSFRTEYK